MAHRLKITLATYLGDGGAIKLDCNKKRVYWLENFRSIGYIKSINYNGRKKATITSGPVNRNLLGVLGDSLYFLNTHENRINVMNVPKGNISQTILVARENYKDLLAVHTSVQPTCE